MPVDDILNLIRQGSAECDHWLKVYSNNLFVHGTQMHAIQANIVETLTTRTKPINAKLVHLQKV